MGKGARMYIYLNFFLFVVLLQIMWELEMHMYRRVDEKEKGGGRG